MITTPQRETLVDSGSLRERLGGLVRKLGPQNPQLRSAIVEDLKGVFTEARDKAETQLLRDGHGTRCAEDLSFVEDQIIHALFDIACRDLFPVASERALAKV